MIAALSPDAESAPAAAQEAKPPGDQTSEGKQFSIWDALATPKADWEISEYRMALMRCIRTRNASEEQRINEHFLASNLGGTEADRKEWAAYGEFVRIFFDRGGDLAKLERLFEDSPNSSEIAEYLAICYSHYDEHAKAASAYERAAETANDVKRRLKLLGDAALRYQGAGQEPQALALAVRMRQLSEETGQGEIEVLETEKKLAMARKEHEAELAALERLLKLNPGDNERRFSLAYKYSDIGRDDLAAYHYSRIPAENRSAVAWNNLGVSLDLLGLPIKSIAAYRKSQKLGETLAMSNLAGKFLRAGFLQEAKEMLDTAFNIKDHHKNIDKALGTIEEVQEAESTKVTANREKAKPLSEYYRQLGRSLAKPLTISIVGHWRAPNCSLEFAVTGPVVVARGSYEVSGLGLINTPPGIRRNALTPLRYVVEYRGNIRGRAIFGSVSRQQEREAPKTASTLLTNPETNPTVLMWIADTGDKIYVLERAANGEPRRYEFDRF